MTHDPALRALILDAGNTQVRIKGWCGGDQNPRPLGGGSEPVLAVASPLLDLGSVPTPTASEPGDFLTSMSLIADQYPDLPVILASVVPQVVPLLRSRWPELAVIDHTWALPFRLSLPQPETVGADRLCNVATAAVSGCRRALVVDAGTATTFDLLLDGEFVGGLIAPGMAFAAAQLGDLAAQLTPVPFVPCPLEPGRDTASAMRAGAYHVGLSGVEAVITALEEKYGPLTVIVTGGLGGLLDGANPCWDPDWTMRGAALLSEPAADFS